MKRPEGRSALLANWRQQPDRATALQRYARLAVDYENATTRIREVRRRAIELLAPSLGETVFDLACGAGAMLPELASRVGPQGRVLAEDIVPATRDRLAERVGRERLDNVAVKLGTPDDAMLPPGSFDRIFLVHMYHEVTSPYAFLWHLRGGLKPGGEVIVVDADRPTKRHGTPPARLVCEFAALGMAPVSQKPIPGADAYFAAFRIVTRRPEPAAIKPCAG